MVERVELHYYELVDQLKRHKLTVENLISIYTEYEDSRMKCTSARDIRAGTDVEKHFSPLPIKNG